MSLILAFLLAFLPLASPFGEATATAVSVEDGLRLEVSVVVEGSPLAVVVRGVGPGLSELPPVALANHGGGKWEGIVDLPVVKNIQLGFESIPPGGGTTTVSEMHSLTELGVDRVVFQTDSIPTTSLGGDALELKPQTRRWGWMGLGTGAAALTLIAIWVIARRRDSPLFEEGEEADPAGADTASDGVAPVADE